MPWLRQKEWSRRSGEKKQLLESIVGDGDIGLAIKATYDAGPSLMNLSKWYRLDPTCILSFSLYPAYRQQHLSRRVMVKSNWPGRPQAARQASQLEDDGRL